MAGMARRRRWVAAVLALVGAIAATATGPLTADGAPSPPATWGTFAHIATNDLSTASAKQTATQNYAVLILRGAITASLLSDLRQRRVGIMLLTYEKSAGLNEADVQAIEKQNPEWIARDADGDAIHPKNIEDTTLGDLTNPAFRAWRTEEIAAEVALGADGAYLDTLGAYFPAEFYTARPVVNGSPVTDRAWRDGSVDLLRRVKAATGRTVVANAFGLGTGTAYYKAAADADLLIAAADGVQIEGFTRWGDAAPDQYRKPAQWDQDLAFLELLGARGKLAFAKTRVNSRATSAQLASLRDYGLGSFLLSFAPGRSYFGFDDGRRIPEVASETVWARNLGTPTATKLRAGTNTWARQFQTGKLTVKAASAPVVS